MNTPIQGTAAEILKLAMRELIRELKDTMKPLKLLARLIKNSSRQGDIVLDTFGGSGSTLITCEQLGRSCYTMELDPKYADVIVKRWLKFTGADHATLQRGGKKMVVEASVF